MEAKHNSNEFPHTHSLCFHLTNTGQWICILFFLGEWVLFLLCLWQNTWKYPMEEGLHKSKVLLKAKLICSLYRLRVGYLVYSFSSFYVHGEHFDMLQAGLGPYLEDLFHLFSVGYLSTQMSHQRSWGAWHHHLSPSHQRALAAVAVSQTRCLCNPEGWRQGLNGICPTKLPAAFSTVLLNTLVQSCIFLGTVWISSGDFEMT